MFGQTRRQTVWAKSSLNAATSSLSDRPSFVRLRSGPRSAGGNRRIVCQSDHMHHP